MKKVQKYSPVWILPLTFVLALSLLWLLFPKSSVPQPVYQKKPLSDWLNPQPVPASPWNYSPFDRYVLNPDGVDAVNALGEDCIPWLLHAITPKPNPWKEGVLKLTKGTGFSWPSNQTGLKAILAFEVLGSRGSEAIPSLLTLLDDPKNFSVMASGVAALCAVADQGISALTEAYEQMDSLPQRSLILGNLMANMKTDQEQILVPFLVNVLRTETDVAIYHHVTEILVRFQVATNDEELTECLMAIPTEDTIDHTEGNEFLGSMGVVA